MEFQGLGKESAKNWAPHSQSYSPSGYWGAGQTVYSTLSVAPSSSPWMTYQHVCRWSQVGETGYTAPSPPGMGCPAEVLQMGPAPLLDPGDGPEVQVLSAPRAQKPEELAQLQGRGTGGTEALRTHLFGFASIQLSDRRSPGTHTWGASRCPAFT